MGIAAGYDEEYWRELYEERVAMMLSDETITKRDAERRAGTYVAIERLRVAVEQAEARRVATRPRRAEEGPREQQATLPGFEEAYQGG